MAIAHLACCAILLLFGWWTEWALGGSWVGWSGSCSARPSNAPTSALRSGVVRAPVRRSDWRGDVGRSPLEVVPVSVLGLTFMDGLPRPAERRSPTRTTYNGSGAARAIAVAGGQGPRRQHFAGPATGTLTRRSAGKPHDSASWHGSGWPPANPRPSPP